MDDLISSLLLLWEMGAHISTLLRLTRVKFMKLVPGFGPGGGTPELCSEPLC